MLSEILKLRGCVVNKAKCAKMLSANCFAYFLVFVQMRVKSTVQKIDMIH